MSGKGRPVVICRAVEFAAPPDELFEAYMDSAAHGAAIGAKASISARVGGRFWVFAPDAVRGRTLLLVPGRLVVQTWRALPWRREDPDSILTLSFETTPRGSRVELVQARVPEHALGIIKRGWEDNYWKPWKARFG